MTRQRKVILEELRGMNLHPTADQLYEAAKKRIPGLSLGTVYRNLDLLSRRGEIRRIEKAGSPMRYDGDLNAHSHIFCVKCGRVADIADNACQAGLVEEKVMETGFRLIGIKVELAGLCPDCQGPAEDHSAEG
ncbi:MAG: transcriptional repressor [Candidatus Krumholzibacteriota bacterium]|nr:transcriptional repressor [Candidatus Krumholzibacteriota bacterium]